MGAPVITLDGNAALPVFLQIARGVVRDIRRGRLKPGAVLPGSRTLARALGVHRNTVLAAYAELTQEGWIETRQARGTFVARSLPEIRPRRFGVTSRARPRVELDLPPPWPTEPHPTVPAGVLPLIGGLPDLRLVPKAALARAYRHALRIAPSTLGYGSELGQPRLRAALAEMLGDTRALRASGEDVLVTRGSQMALFLAARALVTPGDTVAVEALGYRPAWEALKLAGARLAPVPVDGAGIQVDRLRALCERQRIAAVYVTPHHQYPTTVTLAPSRRLALLALAAERRFAVLEDDYDHEFHYRGRPIVPLASADEAGVVVYVGTLSKVFVPGLRIGYAVAAHAVLERMRRVRSYVDRQGDQTVELAAALLIEDGEIARHTRRVQRHYVQRRQALIDALRGSLGAELSFREPDGGMALWARVTRRVGIRVETWAARALRAGVLVHPGARFGFDGRSRPYFRLGFAPLGPEEITRAVAKLAEALRA